MSEKDGSESSRVTLSRRRALAGIGTVGAATALGGLGTYAQFTDTEEEIVPFTAGGIDGSVRAGARYNGEVIQEFDAGGVEPQDDVPGVDFDESGALGLGFELTDVKPGDWGCFSFGITVENNPAWVAACIGYENNIDGQTFEPELENETAEPNATTINSSIQGTDFETRGELAQNILTIPFYKPVNTLPSGQFNPCQFFDEDQEFEAYPETMEDLVATPQPFWSNSEEELVPHTLEEAALMQMVNTQVWGDDGEVAAYDLEDSIATDPGCVFLNGAEYNGSPNQQEAAPLESGTEIWMGWDWHLPFDTGNEVQGDSLDLQLGFVFGQTRHTEDASLSNIFQPGANLPDPPAE